MTPYKNRSKEKMEYIIKKWDILWQKYYIFFASLSFLKKMSVCLGFALLTGLSAQLYINLPFTPVPFTGQVFVVLLAGVLLGKNFGAISQIVYLTGGSVGINWFYASGAGFFRHTTGYMLGFAAAAYIIGVLTEKNNSCAGRLTAMFLGVIVILILGTLWLSLFLRIPITKAFAVGFLPFVPLDLIKAYLAGTVTNSIQKNSINKK